MSAHTLSPGTELRGPQYAYTIVKVLGQGGFGITYLVKATVMVGNIPFSTQFALKEHFISSLCSRDERTHAVEYSAPVADDVDNSRQAFIKEAKRLQALGINHPNIVRINEVFELNNTAYYVMEYLGTTSLRDYVEQHGSLAPAAVRSLMMPLVEAVAMLHRNNVAHYDIKPENVMIHTGDDGTPRAVLIDFGLAKHYTDKGTATSRPMTAGYTPGYAPLEQYAGITKFSPATDVYSLAATLYFAVTGTDPKPAIELNLAEVEARLNGCGDSNLTRALTRAMAAMPADRTPDASALLADLGSTAAATPSRPTSNETVPMTPSAPAPQPKDAPKPTRPFSNNPAPKPKSKKLVLWLVSIPILLFTVVVGVVAMINPSASKSEPSFNDSIEQSDSVSIQNYSVRAKDYSTCSHLDLYATRDDEDYFFSQDEWNAIPHREKLTFDKKGVVLIDGDYKFFVALEDKENKEVKGGGDHYDWNKAMQLYGGNLPNKEEGEIMVKYTDALNNRLKFFGGTIMDLSYWTNAKYDSSYVWAVGMRSGGVGRYLETNQLRVRAVAPVPVASAQ